MIENNKKKWVYSLIVLCLTLLSASSLLGQNVQTLVAIADTYADGGKSSEAFGATQPEQILIKTGSTDAFSREGFVKFDIASLDIEDIGTVKLKMYVYQIQEGEMTISVFSTEDGWNENTLTWAERPDLNVPVLRTATVGEANTYMEWDITDFVRESVTTGKTSISLGLKDVNGANLLTRFYSKESPENKPPHLEIHEDRLGYQAFLPIDDTMTRGGKYADDNYSSGTELTELIVKEGSTNTEFVRKVALKFDLKDIDLEKLSKVGTARLKLHFFKTNFPTPKVDLSVIELSNDWDEGTVTWNTFPTILNPVPVRTTNVDPAKLNQYYEWDISHFVIDKLNAEGADSVFSISISDLGNSNNGATFYSKEATEFHPVLELLEVDTNFPPQETLLSGTYYVDAVDGNDDNAGSTEETAWKSLDKVNSVILGPGTKVLFKAGQEWTGLLKPKGSGEAGNPIVIGRYGNGNKPAIHGNGIAETVHIDNIEYIELRNLEITNYDPNEENGLSLVDWEKRNTTNWADVHQPDQVENSNTFKMGVRVTARDMGEVNHIHLVNLNVHGVNGRIDGTEGSKNNGGIFIEVVGTSVPTYFNGILIEGCHIHDVDRTGLSNVSTWQDRTIDDNGNWTPSLNYVVRKNVFERTGANALILRVAQDPLIEHNLFHKCAIKGSGNAAFNFNTDGAVMQFNEARFTKANVGDVDAGGLDSDFRTKNTLIQYNYLHDNDYGMLATGGGFEGSFNDKTTFRYNIIERDGLVGSENGEKFSFKISGAITNTVFHNNIVYLSPEQKDVNFIFHKLWRKHPNTTKYYNNIFYLEGNNHSFDVGGSSANLYSNNVFYGNGTITWPSDPEAITADPLLAAIGEGVEGYKLTAGSPAIAAGKLLDEMPQVDYFKNAIPSEGPIDIGVNQFTESITNTPGGLNKNDFHIYLLIGQSNMAGRGEIGELDEAELDGAYLFNGEGEWEAAKTPINKYSTVGKGPEVQKMSPGYTFARKLAEYTGKGIGIVSNARGGSSIENWAKGSDFEYPLYDEAVARINEAKKDGVFKGIIWHQGESNQSASSTYLNKLKQLVSDLREDTGEDVFFVAGELGKWRTSSEDINKVIQQIPNEIDQASYIVSDGLSPINNDNTDPHFDGPSQRILGQLYADEILRNVYNMSTGVASLYSECGFKGYKVDLKEGTYNLQELEKRGMMDNALSSLQIKEGYEIRLFANEGDENSLVLTADSDCLDATTVGNDVSYLKIGLVDDTTPEEPEDPEEPDTPLSVGKVKLDDNNIKIIPNPINDNKIRVTLPESSHNISNVSIVNTQGKSFPLTFKRHSDKVFELNFMDRNVADGVYVLTVVTENNHYREKLIVLSF